MKFVIRIFDHRRVYRKFPKKNKMLRLKSNKKKINDIQNSCTNIAFKAIGAFSCVLIRSVCCSISVCFWRFIECILCAHDVMWYQAATFFHYFHFKFMEANQITQTSCIISFECAICLF